MGKKTSADKEIEAMTVIVQALGGLDGDSVQRVLDYVLNRLSLPTRGHLRPAPVTSVSQANAPASDGPMARMPSIKDLAVEKQPESASQMAALVAYYLTEVATPEEQKDSINTADVERYFKQARYRLPKALHSTLPNAAAAGYFDSVGSGHYRLNAVGYNLVVHGLPRQHSGEGKPRKNRTRRGRSKKS